MDRRAGLPSLNAIRSFEAAARLGSFTRAAGELNVTQGAVSRMVRQLEDELGVALFRRGHRRVELTEAGRSYLGPVGEALDRIAAATRLISVRRREDLLSITLLPTFSMRWFMPRLARFQRARPDLLVEVTSSERLVDFAVEPVDVGIRYGRGPWPGVAAERLMGEEVVLLAAPALLDERPIRRPEDVTGHRLLWHSTRPEAWGEWFAAAGLDPGRIVPGPAFEHFFMLIEAAVGGMGVALAPRIFAARELAEGRLLQPTGPSVARRQAYHLVHAPGREREPKIRAFRDWIFDEARADPDGIP